jgi:hypothetical protein
VRERMAGLADARRPGRKPTYGRDERDPSHRPDS